MYVYKKEASFGYFNVNIYLHTLKYGYFEVKYNNKC